MPKCRKCGAELIHENWYPSWKKLHSYRCIPCCKKAKREWLDSHSDREKKRYKQYNRDYYRLHKRELKACAIEYHRLNRDKIRVYNLQHRYGLSSEEFEALWKHQKELCGICETPLSREHNRYGIDHNHKTNKVRGILCSTCNHMLGFIERNNVGLPKVKNYLLRS